MNLLYILIEDIVVERNYKVESYSYYLYWEDKRFI